MFGAIIAFAVWVAPVFEFLELLTRNFQFPTVSVVYPCKQCQELHRFDAPFPLDAISQKGEPRVMSVYHVLSMIQGH